MSVQLLSIELHDLEELYALNQSEVPRVGDVTFPQFKMLIETSLYSKKAVVEGEIAGFIIVFDQSANYQSPNFLWFKNKYPKFLYIDRIAIRSKFRGKGIGQMFYRDAEQTTKNRAPVLTCEVNILPPNETSMRFHKAFGFLEVGQQDTKGGTIRVSLLAKQIFNQS